MKQKEKKEAVEKLMKEGDKRSYNELMADLELQIHKDKFRPFEERGAVQKLFNTKKAW
jgi:hypothetical protein